MLRPFDDLRRYTIGAIDGDVGQLHDAYFDFASWTVRHLVVDTGNWLPGRHVLVSPRAVASIDAVVQRIVTNLTKQQILKRSATASRPPMATSDTWRTCSWTRPRGRSVTSSSIRAAGGRGRT
jgi:hypothetical protein